MTINEILKDFFCSLEKLKNALKNFDFEQTDISDEDISMLHALVKCRIEHLAAFELLLRFSPHTAISIIKEMYISRNLGNHINDQVADLEIMFDDICCILGDGSFEELLNCKEFLSENKKNIRVVEAINFAYDK